MSIKSWIKEYRHKVEQAGPPKQGEVVGETKPWLESFLLWLVRLGTAAAMFTPLVVNNGYFFPFVGPKGLYLMGCCEFVFFAWLSLAINYKKYRPNLNRVLIAFVCFLSVLILASVFGADFSRSFWSNFERMSGVLIWLHLFGWFLAISSALRRQSEWRGIFLVSTGIAILIVLLALLSEAGVPVYKLGGSSLGNTSFLGTYLLFNVFFALYLFFQEKNKYLKIFAAVAVVLCAWSIYSAGARAATLGTIGGFGLIGLLWFSFKPKNKMVRMVSKVVLVASSLTVFVLVVLLFVPGSFVSNKFIELTTASRAVNWQMAWKGFLERPLFGWGLENYILLFPKFFNPCLFTGKCGGEVWFDRTHNIVFDTLATTGVLGLLAYLGLFGAMVYTVMKKYLKQKTISFWTFSIFLALLAAYFVQNLTVFDMPATLMLFAFILGFVAFLARPVRGEATSNGAGEQRQAPLQVKQVNPARAWAAIVLLIVFLVTFFEFVIQPFRADYFAIKAMSVSSPDERMEYYKETFEASPLGRPQIRSFFAQHTQDFVLRNLKTVPKEILVRELDFVIRELKKNVEETPLDYRAAVKLAQIYNVYALLDVSQLAFAEEYGKMALVLSPKNQQSYWVLAQTKLYQKDYQTALQLAQIAVDLEPEWLQSHQILVQVAQRAGQYEKAKEFVQKAIELNTAWAGEFDDILNENKAEAEGSEGP